MPRKKNSVTVKDNGVKGKKDVDTIDISLSKKSVSGKRPSNAKIKELVNMIATFSDEVHIEIFEILKKYMTNKEYTSNNNGVYINLCVLNDEVLIKLEKFVAFCRKNNEELIKREKEYEEARKNLHLKKDSVLDEDKDGVKSCAKNEESNSEINTSDNTNSKSSKSSNNVTSKGVKGKKGTNVDIDLKGANVALHKTKNKFTGLHAKIIKQHKAGNKGELNSDGNGVLGTAGETASVGSSEAITNTIKKKKLAAKKSVKKLMSG